MRARQHAPFSFSVALVTSVAAIAGCNPHVLQQVELDSTAVDENVLQLQVNKDVDVLFVVDNSGSMAQEQITLATNFEAFIGVLEAVDVDANYRIGVTTTDNSNVPSACPTTGVNNTTPEGGKLVLSSCTTREAQFEWPHSGPTVQVYNEACTDLCPESIGNSISVLPTKTAFDDVATARPWIQSIEGVSNLSLDGETPWDDMVQAFQCVGPQGVDGCGYESQLESQYKALALANEGTSAQYGFLRDQAILAIIHVTDEADCSANARVDQLVFSNTATTSPFWNAATPNSSICWNAGTKCEGASPYANCTSQSYNFEGAEVGDDYDGSNADGQQQVLYPLKRYLNQIDGIANDKAILQGPEEIIVSVIGGVPEGYSSGIATLVYQDSPDPGVQSTFGIDYGCSSTVGGAEQNAVPPVRLREFAEAFYTPVMDSTVVSNLFSICSADYSPALEAVAEAIKDQLKPGCFESCVEDVGSDDGLQVQCKVTQEVPLGGGGTRTDTIPNCAQTPASDPANMAGVCYVELTGAAMTEECILEGWNLEFKIERDGGSPVPGGTVVSANCQLSDRPAEDCPNL
jgi:hypothetical protein